MPAKQTRLNPATLVTTAIAILIAAMLLVMPAAKAQAQTQTTVSPTVLSDARLRVDWTPVSGVTAYNVQLIRGTGSGGDLNDVTSRDVSTGYTSRSLLPNTEYSVRVFDATDPNSPTEVGRATATTSVRLAPGSVPRARSIDISEDEFAVAWLPAQRTTSYKLEYRRHDEQFADNGELSVSIKESLEFYAYVGSGNADTTYYVRITPQRDYASDGPSYTKTVRTMASGENNPWDEYTFNNATLSEAFPCNGGILPLRKEEIYKSSSSVRKYVENCIIDIGTRTQGTFRSDHYFGSKLLLDVHNGLSDIRRGVWFDGKTVQFQHPLTIMSIRASGVTHTYGVSRGMQASIGGQSIDLLRCIRGPSDNTKRSECTVDIASTTTKLVITPAGTGSITVDVNGTDAGGDVSGSLASGLTLTLPQSEDGDIITIDMPSVTVGDERYVFKIRTRPPPDADAPAQVTGLASTDVTDDSITVSWTAIADVDRYVVEHSTDSTFATKSTTNVRKQGSNPPATSVTLDGLTATTTYYVRVYAVNSDGNGLRSTPLTIATSDVPPPPVAPPAPAAPTGLTISMPSEANGLRDHSTGDGTGKARRETMKKLEVDWEAVTIPSGALTYKVEWHAKGESYTYENSYTTIAIEYDITGLKRNTEYTVRVSAIATKDGLSTTGPATSKAGRTRISVYDCANVDGSISITGSVPEKMDLVANQESDITMPSYTGPVCFLDIYIDGRVLRREQFTNDSAPPRSELGPRQNGARDMLGSRMEAASYNVGTQTLTLQPKETTVSLGYQDMLMSVAWSPRGWKNYTARTAEVRIHNLEQLTIGANSGDFRVSKQNGVVSIRGGVDRSYRAYSTDYNSGGYEIEACNITNGDCGSSTWNQIHKSTRASGSDGYTTFGYTLPNSDNAYRFRVREYLDLRHNSEVAYSEWSTAARVN